ncbi:high-affinity iron permease [Spinellus fusiger]|nr:high-affinity iron permease [Spinellus fusiger]
MSQDLFNLQIFFIVFRRTTEAAIIISILLSFLKRVFEPRSETLKKIRKYVWLGSAASLLICLCIGSAFIAVWYTVQKNLWRSLEEIWEGVFSLIACILITVMGLAILKIEHMQDSWDIKLAQAMETRKKNGSFKACFQLYYFALLPFITMIRTGLEIIIYIGGLALDVQAKSVPIAVITGLFCGLLVGVLIYYGGYFLKPRWFFTVSTIALCLIAAGLMSKSVGLFEDYVWNHTAGGKEGNHTSHNVATVVWSVAWGDPELNTGKNIDYQMFNSLLGWNNAATIATVTIYSIYWLVVNGAIAYMYYMDRREVI